MSPRTYQAQDELEFMRSCQAAYRARLPEGADQSRVGPVIVITEHSEDAVFRFQAT